jgi:hypothetical protein
VAQVCRWLLERGARLRRLGDRGEGRHLLLVVLVVAFVVVVFNWQERVTCIYRSVTSAVSSPGGGSGLSC